MFDFLKSVWLRLLIVNITRDLPTLKSKLFYISGQRASRNLRLFYPYDQRRGSTAVVTLFVQKIYASKTRRLCFPIPLWKQAQWYEGIKYEPRFFLSSHPNRPRTYGNVIWGGGGGGYPLYNPYICDTVDLGTDNFRISRISNLDILFGSNRNSFSVLTTRLYNIVSPYFIVFFY